MTIYYQDDNVTLYHGDCAEVLPNLQPGSVDQVLVDLPYGMTDCAWDTPLDLQVLWAEWKRLLTPAGSISLTASQPFTSTLVASNPRAFKTEWIWEKNAGSNFGTLKRTPMKEHESVLVFAFGKYTYNPQMQERAASGLSRVKSGVVNYRTKTEVYAKGGLTGEASSNRPDLRYPRSIQKFNRERGLHPTQKPVDLMRYMIRSYTEAGATVLDHCAGSGSTLIGATREGRKSIGVELEERYCEVIAKRCQEEVGALFGAGS